MMRIYDFDRIGTDENYVVFYMCPSCEFERVPHIENLRREEEAYPPEGQTHFCPQCATPVEWINLP